MFPSSTQIVREAITVIAGAMLAAFIIGQIPQAKAWIKQQWS
jgi:FlaG/FlaF family flagellin (archaellin)